MVTLAGIGSVRLTPETAALEVFPIVIVKVEVPPLVIEVGANDLDKVKGEVITANRALVEKSEL